MHILQKIFTYTKCHIFTFTTFTLHLILYIHNTASGSEDPGKVFRLQHLHLKNYLKTENCEPNELSECYKFKMLLSAVCTSQYENLYINGCKTVYEKTEFLL